MRIRDAILAESLPLPPIGDLAYQYVIAGNGLFIRAEDSRMEAMAPVALAHVHGLERVEPYARLKVPRVPGAWLLSVLRSARHRLPNEAMYQFLWDHEQWKCIAPVMNADATSVTFPDSPETVIDLHSHGTMAAFFSDDDDDDERGLRFYATLGKVDTNAPQIAVRVGVYGHRWNVPMSVVFDELGVEFIRNVDPEVEQVLAEDEDDE